MKTVTLYTDGACSGNPGPGGWGAILSFNGVEKELSGGEANTTNNRMELTAVIRGLQALKEPCIVELYSDSKYVIDALEKAEGEARSARFVCAIAAVLPDGTVSTDFLSVFGPYADQVLIPQLLEIAGDDGVFVPAEGAPAGGSLRIWNHQVAHPVSVRYAWTDYSDRVNLFGENGLPLEPFLL